MPGALIHPPKSMLEIWETLPEGTLCQLINNKLVMSPSPVDIHQVILNEINIEIALYLRKNKMGEIRIAPYDVHFSKENILQPDIVFIKSENVRKIKSRGLFGVPDLVIEILSPSTSHLDFEEKKLIYEKYGVSEYFLVEPNSKLVTSFLLKNEEYKEQKKAKAVIKSVLLKAEIKF
ncbi:MAG: Uma2 family endonuclease [Bacteroidota bacterium]|nr:Uma2 family endonuclease [Bacteroidota bacterium]